MNWVYGRANRAQRNEMNKEWRGAFCLLAKEQKIPRLERVKILAWPMLRDRRVQDVGACYPAVKAAIDGLEDAGVIPEDDPRYLTVVAMGAPVQEAPYDALRVMVVHDPI
jgi:crossover junction endodeoxyribonuclease RusA